MKVLNEYNGNSFAKAIRAVEDCMERNKVTIDFIGSGSSVTINGREYRTKVTTWPRTVEGEEEKLYREYEVEK